MRRLIAKTPLWLRGAALAFIACAVFATVGTYIGWERIAAQLAQLSAWHASGSAIALGGALGLRVMKWRYVLGPGANASTVFFLSKAAGDWSPGRVGELSPLMFKSLRSQRVGAWILMDRVLEIAIALAFGLAGLAAVFAFGGAAWAGSFSLAIIFTASFGLSWIAATRAPKQLPRLDPPEGLSRLQRVRYFARLLWREAAQLGSSLPAALALTFVARGLDIAAVMLLFKGTGAEVGYWLAAAGRMAHWFVAALPIGSPQTGAPHLAEGYFLHELGGIDPASAAVAIPLEALIYSAVFWGALGLRLGCRGFLTKDHKEAKGYDAADS